jgi:hypothetical protein
MGRIPLFHIARIRRMSDPKRSACQVRMPFMARKASTDLGKARTI